MTLSDCYPKRILVVAWEQVGCTTLLRPLLHWHPDYCWKKLSKFPEAKQMLQNGGLVSIKNSAGLKNALDRFITDEKHRENCGQKNGGYVANNKGASAAILERINFLLKD